MGRKGLERRDQIVEVAIKTFAKFGYQEASIERICQEVGIARGTLYQYFEDKKHLFREILQDYVKRIQVFMQPFTMLRIELPDNQEDLTKLLATRFLHIFTTLRRDKDIYTILFKEAAAKTTATEDLVREVDKQFLSLMISEMRAAKDHGVLECEDLAFAANFILGGLFKTAQEFIFDADKPRSLETLADQAAILVGKMIFKA